MPLAAAGVDALLGAGLWIQDDFIGAGEAGALRECAVRRHRRGEFREARIGGADGTQRRGDIRGDLICWLAGPLCRAERRLLEALEQLRITLNREAMLGLFELELHYARYAPGTGYARHVDQPQGSTQRQVSLAIYLNEGWEPAAGGALRVFDPAGSHTDAVPLAGRLVIFLSAGREHQVLPARCVRWSISGWFRTR